MGIIIFSIIMFFSFLGIYYLIREIIYYKIYKKMDISKDIECNIIINNCRENNLEMFFKKFLYMYMDNNIFENITNITIVARNVDENSRYILKQIEDEYSFIKVVENK